VKAYEEKAKTAAWDWAEEVQRTFGFLPDGAAAQFRNGYLSGYRAAIADAAKRIIEKQRYDWGQSEAVMELIREEQK
jgi:hypothetical protein